MKTTNRPQTLITGASDEPAGGPHDPMHHDAVQLPSERSTGLVFAGVGAIAAVLFRDVWWLSASLAVAAAGFVAAALTTPRLLAGLNRRWFGFALALNRIMSPIVMFVLFALVIVPAGLLMQLRRDPLQKRPKREAESYWRPRTDLRASMTDQF